MKLFRTIITQVLTSIFFLPNKMPLYRITYNLRIIRMRKYRTIFNAHTHALIGLKKFFKEFWRLLNIIKNLIFLNSKYKYNKIE